MSHSISSLDHIDLSPADLALHAEYLCAVREARAGNPQNYVRFQWPKVILDTFQWDMVRCVAEPAIREVFVKGNTGCGKGAAAAICICMYYDLWEDAKIVITSSSVEHAGRVLFAEVCKWFKLATFRPKGNVLTEFIRENEQHRIDVVNPEKDEGFAGSHSEHVMFAFDEATSIADSRYTIANTQAKLLMGMANPRTIAGAFRDAFGKINPDKTQTIMGQFGPRRLITVDGDECLNVRMKCLDKPVGPIGGIEIDGKRFEEGDRIPDDLYVKVKPVIPGQTTYDQHISMLNDPDPFNVRVFAHARFPDEDPETQLIFSSWLDRHFEYWSEAIKSDQVDVLLPVTAFGLDVSSTLTGDENILTCGGSRGMRGMFARRFGKTTDVGRWVLKTVEEQYGFSLEAGCHPIAVDADGIGKGTCDFLTDRGVAVIEIHGNAAAERNPHKYANKRTESYGEFASRVSPDDKYSDQPFGLPEMSGMLREELCCPEKEPIGNDGLRFRITPKDNRGKKDIRSVKQRLGRSPDRGDATVYLYQAILMAEETGSIVNQLDPTTFKPDPSWALDLQKSEAEAAKLFAPPPPNIVKRTA